MIEDSYILEGYTGERVKETLDQVSENTANIESLETSLNNEVANRITGDAALDSKIAGEKNAREEADAAEKEQRELADDALRDSISAEETERKNADTAITARVDKSLFTLDSSYEEESVTIYGYSDKENSTPIANADIDAATQSKAGVMSAEDKRHLDAALYEVEETDYFPDYVETQIRGYDGDGHSVTVKAATKTEAGVMSSADKTALDALALYNAKSVITVAGMDFTQGDILEILKGHRPTRYAVKYETETSSYVCGILDAYTSRDGRIFTEIYTGGCDLAKDFTGGTHDSGRIYQFMRQYRIFGSGTPAAGTWSAWQSCLSSAAMEELYAMGLDYEVFEGETDGYIEVKLTGKEGGVVGGSTEIPFASAAKSGFMSKEDKARLDGMETGANRTVVVQGYGDNAASVMSQAAVTKADNELLKRLQGVSDSSDPYTDPFKSVRFSDGGYWAAFNEWLDGLHTAIPETDHQKAGFFRVSLWGILCEVKNLVINWDTMRFHQIVSGNLGINSQGKVGWSDKYTTLQRRYDNGAWSEWQEDAYETRKTIADDLRTAYTDKGVSLNLYNGDTRLFGDSIAAATQSKAGVMSAEDKIEQRNIRTFIETFKKNLIPSGLTVSCLERITLGNVEPIYITAELTPDTAYRNIIYISDNKAVTVGTDGRVTPVSVGKSVVSVIPTCNTSLAKTIIVEVGRPFTRLVNNRSTLRFTSSGTFRLT